MLKSSWRLLSKLLSAVIYCQMPRKRTPDNTPQFPKDFAQRLPFLSEFIKDHVRRSTFTKSTTVDIFGAYNAFVCTKTSDATLLIVASSKARFAKQFSERSRREHFDSFSNPVRGYYVSLSTPEHRQEQRPARQQELRDFFATNRPYDSNELMRGELCSANTPGNHPYHKACAAQEIPAGTIICEFYCHMIEADRMQPCPCAEVVHFADMSCEGLCPEEIVRQMNMPFPTGQCVQQSRTGFNCRFIKLNRRVAIIANETVLAGEYLFVDYGEPSRKLPAIE